MQKFRVCTQEISVVHIHNLILLQIKYFLYLLVFGELIILINKKMFF